MISFVGDFQCKIDSKGRVGLPVSFRNDMLESQQTYFVVKKDVYENCLVLYPQFEWEKTVAYLKEKLNPFNKKQNNFLRLFLMGALKVSIDASGRILLPKRIQERVNIIKDVFVIGNISKIEIWSTQEYEKIKVNNDDFESLAEEILG